MMPRWLTWSISVIAFVILGNWILDSAMALAGDRISYPGWFEESRDYIEITLATVVIIAVTKYEGRESIGFGGSLPVNARISLQWSFLFLAAGTLLYFLYNYLLIGMIVTGDLPKSALGVANNPPDLYHRILSSIHAGWVEEILIVGLLFFIFKRVPWRINGTAFALTGFATAISVALRVSFHTYQGVWIIPLILTGWLMVRLYRAMGTIIPLVVGHVAWDLSELLSTRQLMYWSAILPLILTFVLTRGTGAQSIFGFPYLQSQDRNWYGFYWARWRWQPALEKPGQPATHPAPRPPSHDHVGLQAPDAAS